jgi:hypothetical protein
MTLISRLLKKGIKLMPAPWTPDATKNATLQALAAALDPNAVVHADSAWALVRGQTGFTNIDSTDDLFYVRYNWPGISGQTLVKAAEKEEAAPEEAPKKESKSEHHSHSKSH